MSELRERVAQAKAILGPMGHTSITLDDEHDYTVENLFDDLATLLTEEEPPKRWIMDADGRVIPDPKLKLLTDAEPVAKIITDRLRIFVRTIYEDGYTKGAVDGMDDFNRAAATDEFELSPPAWIADTIEKLTSPPVATEPEQAISYEHPVNASHTNRAARAKPEGEWIEGSTGHFLGHVHGVGTEHPHKPEQRRYIDITGPFPADLVGREVEIRVLPTDTGATDD